ncbi:MAG: hypothetical protein GTN74_06920 [Proteobacteria bacterium]|nr:hypothetical protein [Pseudomonadota bacterium]NIS69329.1 hypothetical protein [Pseudomonadota bacterium]
MEAGQAIHFLDSFFPYLFAPFFIVLWGVICHLISLMGGWRELAREYQMEGPFSGELFRFQSAQMRGRTNYSACLTVGGNVEGLYLSVLFVFRPGHPPLFVPWSEISGTIEKRKWFSRVTLRFQRCPSIPFVISTRLSERISHASGAVFYPEGTV